MPSHATYSKHGVQSFIIGGCHIPPTLQQDIHKERFHLGHQVRFVEWVLNLIGEPTIQAGGVLDDLIGHEFLGIGTVRDEEGGDRGCGIALSICGAIQDLVRPLDVAWEGGEEGERGGRGEEA